MTHMQSLAVVLALTLTVVTSSAIMPVVPLSEMAEDHACYFMCHICFHTQETEMMDCVNKVCGGLQSCGAERDAMMLWVGHRCQHFPQLMAAMGPDPHSKN